MNTYPPTVAEAVATIAKVTGVNLALLDNTITVDGKAVELPAVRKRRLIGSYGELLGIKGLLPTVPQGDDRDRLLWRIIAEARTDYDPSEVNTMPLDVMLLEQLPGRLAFADAEAGQAVTDAIQDRFFGNKSKVKNLKPIHSSLPMNYAHGNQAANKPARWRMFSPEILVFLLYDETTGTSDRGLIEELLEFVDTTQDLTSIDRLFLDVADQDTPFPGAATNASALIDRYENKIRADLSDAGGAFCPTSLALFRRDLKTVLATKLPKSDMVQWLTLLLSLHIATRMYRLAVVKGNELDLALAAATGSEPPSTAQPCACPPANQAPDDAASEGSSPNPVLAGCLTNCPLAGAIKFRTGTGRYRPVSLRDPCHESHVQLDERRLLALPGVLVTTNLALRAWTAVGGPPHAAATAFKLAQALKADPVLRTKHNAVCAALATLVHAEWRPDAASTHLADTAGINGNGQHLDGLVALRDTVLRQRRTDLRHQSRDVVNQLILDRNAAGGGSLISRNGTRYSFFEVDERLLVMLVRLVCPEPMPYDVFLTGLADYGLAPQDANERAALADSLERLGLLIRYSDAGEASFVHYR